LILFCRPAPQLTRSLRQFASNFNRPRELFQHSISAKSSGARSVGKIRKGSLVETNAAAARNHGKATNKGDTALSARLATLRRKVALATGLRFTTIVQNCMFACSRGGSLKTAQKIAVAISVAVVRTFTTDFCDTKNGGT
jgi:hypothetical protein